LNVRAIILENEASAQETLLNLLTQFCPHVQVLGVASTVVLAKDLIIKHSPDLLLMDIELDHGISLDLFTFFPAPSFNVIFTTAHQEYALQAIKASCLDYLLKPIDFRELQEAINKHDQKKQVKEQEGRLQNLIHNLHQPKVQRLAVPTQDGYVFCAVSDIIACIADGNYTQLKTLSHGSLVSSKTLGDIETLLPTSIFFRSHKSYLINLHHVESYVRAANQIIMKGGFNADLATRRKEEFFAHINLGEKIQ